MRGCRHLAVIFFCVQIFQMRRILLEIQLRVGCMTFVYDNERCVIFVCPSFFSMFFFLVLTNLIALHFDDFLLVY